jgi:hypothetical protein
MYVYSYNKLLKSHHILSSPLWSHPPSLDSTTLLYSRRTECSRRTRLIILIYHVKFCQDSDQFASRLLRLGLDHGIAGLCQKSEIATVMPERMAGLQSGPKHLRTRSPSRGGDPSSVTKTITGQFLYNVCPDPAGSISTMQELGMYIPHTVSILTILTPTTLSRHCLKLIGKVI